MVWPFATRRERIRREAAAWIARLNGPHAPEDRAAFERWYRSDPDRAEAHDRLSAIFRAAGQLTAVSAKAEPSIPRHSRPMRYLFATAALGAAILALVLLSGPAEMPVSGISAQIATFSTDGARSRRIRLADGSEILLSPGAELRVAIGARERRLRLNSGEARFTVAHEARPFIVEARGTEVVARGTEFVVRLAAARTTVSLIQGRVDVSYPQLPGRGAGRRVAHLLAGQQLVVEAAGEPGAAAGPAGAARASAQTPTMIGFDNMPLDQAIARINASGPVRIRLADPSLGRLRVTGAFRAGDSQGFAEGVAAAFGLDLERSAGGLLLRPASHNGGAP